MPTSATSTSRNLSKCKRCRKVRHVHHCDSVEDCFAEGLCAKCAETAGDPQRRLIIFELERHPPVMRRDLEGRA